MKMIRRIQSHNRNNDGPSTEQSGAQRGQLVLGLGVIVRWDQLLDRVLRVEFVRLGWELGVWKKSTVVESSRIMEG